MIQKSPAFSFYAKDFLTGTATMSLTERGAYVTLLAHEWDAGVVPLEPSARARVLGCTPTHERTIWNTLSAKFSRRPEGFINLRLEEERRKQIDRRQKLALNGSKGGATTAANKQQLPQQLGQQKSSLAFSSSSSSDSLQNKESKPSRATRVDERFESWWQAYPKKTGKGAAIKAWAKINPSAELVATMIDALSWQRNQPQWTKEGGTFIPNPATYLNQRRWEDEPFFTTTTATDDDQHLAHLAAIERGEAKY